MDNRVKILLADFILGKDLSQEEKTLLRKELERHGYGSMDWRRVLNYNHYICEQDGLRWHTHRHKMKDCVGMRAYRMGETGSDLGATHNMTGNFHDLVQKGLLLVLRGNDED